MAPRALRITINTLSVGAGNEGIRTYLLELVAALDRMESPHHYRLVCSVDNAELFAHHAPNLERVLLTRRRPAVLIRLWRDQLTVPWLVRHSADVLFTPSSVGSVFAPVPQVVAVPAHLAFRSVRRGLPGPTLSVVHRLYYGPIMRLSHRRAQAVAPISDFLARRLVEDNAQVATKVVTVPCGVAPAPVLAVPAVADHGPPLVLFVGTLYQYKNADGLIHAASLARARLPGGFRVVIVGRDPDGRQHLRLQAVAEALGVGDVVELTGSVDTERLEALYGQARVLVFPSLAEGFGLPLLEAMARGVPVVAAARGALPEVVGEAGLLFDPDRPQQLADAIVELCRDADLCRRLVAAGRLRAAEFSWDRAAAALTEVFERVAR